MNKRSLWFGMSLFILVGLSACTMPDVGGTAADNVPPVIRNLRLSDENVFYNDSSCGPTALSISLDVADDSGSIASVGLQYRYRTDNNFGASLAWRDVALTSAGNGKFSGDLDIAAEAGAVLGQVSGALEYQVYAVDIAGNIRTMPATTAASLPVQYCNAGIASDPVMPNNAPVAPPTVTGFSSNGVVATPTDATTTTSGSGNPVATSTPDNTFIGNPSGGGTELAVTSISASPNTIYYGGCLNNEPQTTTFNAVIGPADLYAQGKFVFVLADKNSNVIANFGGDLGYNGGDNYSLLLGDFASIFASSFGGDNGYIQYWVEALSKTGATLSSDVGYVDVIACIPPVTFNDSPVINYFNGPSDAVISTDSYTLLWDVSNADCGVYLDGSSVVDSGSTVESAPYTLGTETITHYLEARGGDCDNPQIESQHVTVTVQAESGGSLLSGGYDLRHDETYDLDLLGGDDVSFEHTSIGPQLYNLNGSLFSEWFYGQGASPENCKLEIEAGRGSTVLDVSRYDYVCYKTGQGNYGYLFITNIILDPSNNSSSSISFTYETLVTP
ncbi:MAG: hypothetical protein L3J16_00025 [Anaerolineales bacterium]|nr:hypothetical protein [Anaerolineales bacterium]